MQAVQVKLVAIFGQEVLVPTMEEPLNTIWIGLLITSLEVLYYFLFKKILYKNNFENI